MVVKMNMVVFIMVVFVTLGILGYPNFEDDQSPSSDQSNWRMKRKSPISCHCCSHSFNSHCCLQCMSRLRIGKRSHEAKLSDINQWADPGDDMDEDLSLVEDNMQQEYLTDLVNDAVMCSCCLRLKNGDPFPQRWPCCRKCLGLSNGLT